MSGNVKTCSEEGCDEPSLEDCERCAYHRADLEDKRQAIVNGIGRGLTVLGPIVVSYLFGRGSSGGSS